MDSNKHIIPEAQLMDFIFINYRRSDSASFVEMLVAILSQHFPADKIFHDKISITKGENYINRIDKVLSECGFFIPVIGKNWISELGETGPN